MHSPDLTQNNIAKLAELFPNCVIEAMGDDGILKRAIDFDQLRQELSDHVVDGPRERYQLNWPGKRDSLLVANGPIAKTLRPCTNESVNFESTKNLFIEGDNLDCLKLIQEAFLGKVKMIYIDPPYNTGNDFLYLDDFYQSEAEYFQASAQVSECGEKLIANPQSNGRFHSAWLTMIMSRVKLCRNLLRDDGVIFFSIGEEELSNSIRVLDEVFGSENFVSVVPRVAKTASNLGTHFASSVDFIVVYAKSIDKLPPFRGEVDESLYKKIESEGPRRGDRYRDDIAFYQSSQKDLRPNQKFFIECPDGSRVLPPCSIQDETMREGDGRWRWSKETFLRQKHLLVFKETKTSPLVDEYGNQAKFNIYTKSYLSDRESAGTLPRNIITEFINRQGADLIKKLSIPFDFSKPIGLIQYLIKIQQMEDNDIVLDFFAGSATTAHAVLQQNSEDGIKRRFVMIQLPEKCPEGSEAANAGFETIADIGKERVRRAGNRIVEERGLFDRNLDIGFRVLKIDTSNMKDVYYQPDALRKDDLFTHVDNIKEDRTPEDLLFQVLLDWGVELTLPIEQENIDGKTVFFVDKNALAACFDTSITEELVKKLATRKPMRVVFRDSGFSNDSVKINVEQIFKLMSPGTEVKSI